jgi:tellurite resistance protein TerC
MMELMATVWLGQPVWMWAGFMAMVVALLFVDLFVLHRDHHVISVRESLLTTSAYAVLAVLFSGFVWHEMGQAKAMEFLTGYVVEFSLSMDNVFVMAMIIGYFKIPAKYQHQVLLWGILGAIVMRGIMIILGAALVKEFSWILLVFGFFLLVSGVKMFLAAGDHGKEEIKDSAMMRLLNRYGRVTKELHGDKFWVRLVDKNTGHYAYYMTPLMAALLMIEMADVVFAVDSVPAIFAITTDAYIVYTSNIFAILGLRSLYFTLGAMVQRFAYLKYALAMVLVLVGCKILLASGMGIHLPTWLTLLATVGILAGGIVYSLRKTQDVVVDK